ncbi:MAG TPA: beta-ketoacyl-ACP synthase III [Armatimonadota bacterium]|nr:beta-ketoacyl-ACP synthase III [Armatimonadota bacterium]
MKSVQPVGIVSVGAYAPPGILSNTDLEKIVETSDEWIRQRSGICRRHIADENTATSDIAFESAKIALERAGMTADELDLITVATITPDRYLPSTACFLQHRLGAVNAAAFDISAACTGFIYALSVASAQVATGQFRNALVIGAETLSKITDYTDRRTCVLLGDGGGAVILKPVEEGRGIQSFYLRADGSGADVLHIPAGGSRMPASQETVEKHLHYFRMNGAETFKFAVRAIDEAINTALTRAGLTKEDITLVIPHQANSRIIEAAAKRLGIPEDRWVNNIAEYGNTSAGSIPLALNETYEAGRLHKGDVLVFVGFGGGLTWGATVIRW